MGVIRKDNLTISTANAVWLNTLSGYFEHEPPRFGSSFGKSPAHVKDT